VFYDYILGFYNPAIDLATDNLNLMITFLYPSAPLGIVKIFEKLIN
jgi:hypothetical protein